MKDGGANKSGSRGQGKHRRPTRGRRGLQTQEKKQAAVVSGIACKLHFIAKFKFKFITTNSYGPLKCRLQPGAFSPTLQGSQDLPPITSQTFPPYFSTHTDLCARRSHRSSGSLPLGHRTCCSLCPQCFPHPRIFSWVVPSSPSRLYPHAHFSVRIFLSFLFKTQPYSFSMLSILFT